MSCTSLSDPDLFPPSVFNGERERKRVRGREREDPGASKSWQENCPVIRQAKMKVVVVVEGGGSLLSVNRL